MNSRQKLGYDLEGLDNPDKHKKNFDEDYFDNPETFGYGNYDHNDWYEREAEKLFLLFNPDTMFDFGCAKGLFASNFTKLGCKSYGMDVSPYAINNAVEGAKGKIILGDEKDLAMFRDKSFDLVMSFATLEHIHRENAEYALKQLVRISKRYLYLTIPTSEDPNDYNEDPTHINILPKSYWLELFKQCGLKVIEHEVIDDPNAFALEKEWREAI